jgi:hypothetical protein
VPLWVRCNEATFRKVFVVHSHVRLIFHGGLLTAVFVCSGCVTVAALVTTKAGFARFRSELFCS